MISAGTVIGALVGTYIGTRLASERWERRRIAAVPTGTGLSVALGF